MTDVVVSNQGTIIQFRPVTDAGREWIDENVQSEGWQWLGAWLSVDWRFAAPLIEGMQNAGLNVGMN